MLDGHMRKIMDPAMAGMGRWFAANGVDADTITLIGLGFGLLSAIMIAGGLSGFLVLMPMLIGRLFDGLDGAIARASHKTDFGGYLDLTCDFLFYGAIPLAFVFRDVDANGAAGAFLLLSFYLNGMTFMGYAVLAERAKMETDQRGEKSLYFTAGLMEGTETVIFFAFLALFPGTFWLLAWVFGLLCFATAGARVVLAWKVFTE